MPRPKLPTFAIAPRAPRHGSSASTTKSSKCSSRRESATPTACRGSEVPTIGRSVRTPSGYARLWLRPTRTIARLVSAPIVSSTPGKSGRSRALVALACLAFPATPAAAIVGGAPFADQAIARHVVLIVGGHSLCTGVAIAPDLVLTAAHCVLGNGKYRLLAFEGRRPVVKDVASVAPHPQFSPRADAPDLALVKLVPPAANLAPAPFSGRRAPPLVGDRFIVAGFGVGVQGDGKTAGKLRGHAGRDRSAKLAATRPDRSPETRRNRRPGRLQRRFRRAGIRRAGPRAGRDRELVGAHRRRTRLRFRQWRHTARELPLLDPGDGSETGVAAGTMIRIAIVLICTCALASPLSAMVGGAPPTSEGAGRAVVMLTGSHGTFCSGVALRRDLVLTAAHCVLPGANYKLVEFDAARQPALKDLAIIARHPDFDVNAVLRHRVTADVALVKLTTPLQVTPALLAPAGGSVVAGDRFVVAGYGVAVHGDGKTGGTVRAATLVATGQPGTLQIRLADPATKGERAGLGACTGDSGAPVYREVGGVLAVIGVVSWTTGPALSEGCGGLTGVTPLARYRAWMVEQAGKMGSPLSP